jgi:hypothetical protein
MWGAANRDPYECLLVGERLHRRTDAEELLRIIYAGMSFLGVPRTSHD